jgi:cytochrome b6-f complex iron-sulfur subunit
VSEKQNPPSRRDLLAAAGAAGAGLGLFGTVVAWGAALKPKVLYEPPDKRRLGPPGSFPPGVTFLADDRVFILREEDGYRALSAVCTHLGCTVGRESGGFHCPCHGSTFGPDGGNLSGPAPKPLPWHPLTLVGGSLVVDLGAEVGPKHVLQVEPPK